MKLISRRALTVSSVVLAAVLLAACGGTANSSGDQIASLNSGSTQAGVDTSTTATTSSASFQETLLKFTRCMRSNGVNIPDPTFDANGRPQFQQQGSGNPPFDQNDPKFQAAQKKCGPILQSLQSQFSTADRQAFQAAALKYAQCMRQNGVDIPDPDFSNGGLGPGTGGGLFGNVNQNDPKFQVANQKCQSAFQNLRGPFGGGAQGGTTTGSQ